MNSEKQSSKIEDLLFDSAVRIAVHDGTDNDAFQRRLAELQNPSKTSANAAARPLRKFAPSDSEAPARAENGKNLG